VEARSREKSIFKNRFLWRFKGLGELRCLIQNLGYVIFPWTLAHLRGNDNRGYALPRRPRTHEEIGFVEKNAEINFILIFFKYYFPEDSCIHFN
jgi:hypothetical protein